MNRTLSLLTIQWADLPFEEVAKLASQWGFDGLEIACAGDHLDPWRGATDDNYIQEKLNICEKYGLKITAIANHLKSQAVCDDPIDERHHRILPAKVWGDGDPEGVRQRAAEEVVNTARTAQRMGVTTVVGFTGSSIWKYVAMFPPVDDDLLEAGWEDFAKRWNPILDEFASLGVRFAAEVHPSELAYDYWTTKKMLETINRPQLGINWDPSHLNWMDIDPAAFLYDFADKIYNVHAKDSKKRLDGRNGRLGSHLPWADPRRGWSFVSVGHGDVPWESCFRALNWIGYEGPVTVEWEDSGMDRLFGAPEALEFVRRNQWAIPAAAFDKAFAVHE
ncbi:sugar phosphate isomerase/epimerase family protein [Propionibacterium australiense]|uniref:AP endonuclease family 2 C terminus n=1 Tax=Propionibacterium australiense TaxID=119981 RepID=A0A383SAZ3_9ACTN|nr:sugar phosphate isomerase/epimerase family protein [Propionibacterium australiense]RLP09586.1 sugar phosphate isomerase/epimerase [Propionibacterium australiense]RLP12288.1 sugar phosphate isomerase/epimerase [Propionibacterium australiense]SYZ34539.1 AP endonuclease family 2 C terminus [Propionibacterium australiense]VEH89685.1 Hydroxypyruvate isomerase [Propionibacterium australiense]